MTNVTVNLSSPSLYAEPDSRIYRFKRKLSYKHVLGLIHKMLNGKREFFFLEVGTGSGFLMNFLEKSYPLATLKGIEYDPRLVELGNEKLLKKSIVQGNAEEFTYDNKFDLVVSLQVIEHLYEPNKMIESVKKCIKEDGVFIFTTPNLGCLSKRVMGDKWHGFRDDHVSLKDCKGWDDFMSLHGFERIYSGSTFFTGIPILNRLPLGIFNWLLLLVFGSLRWGIGESYVGVFKLKMVNK